MVADAPREKEADAPLAMEVDAPPEKEADVPLEAPLAAKENKIEEKIAEQDTVAGDSKDTGVSKVDTKDSDNLIGESADADKTPSGSVKNM